MFKLHVKPPPTFLFFYFVGVEWRREGKVRKSERPYKNFIDKTSKYHDRSVLRSLIKEKALYIKICFVLTQPQISHI